MFYSLAQLLAAGIVLLTVSSANSACTSCGANDQEPSFTPPPARAAMFLGAAGAWQTTDLLDGFVTIKGVYPSEELGLIVYGDRSTPNNAANSFLLWKAPGQVWKFMLLPSGIRSVSYDSAENAKITLGGGIYRMDKSGELWIKRSPVGAAFGAVSTIAVTGVGQDIAVVTESIDCCNPNNPTRSMARLTRGADENWITVRSFNNCSPLAFISADGSSAALGGCDNSILTSNNSGLTWQSRPYSSPIIASNATTSGSKFFVAYRKQGDSKGYLDVIGAAGGVQTVTFLSHLLSVSTDGRGRVHALFVDGIKLSADPQLSNWQNTLQLPVAPWLARIGILRSGLGAVGVGFGRTTRIYITSDHGDNWSDDTGTLLPNILR